MAGRRQGTGIDRVHGGLTRGLELWIPRRTSATFLSLVLTAALLPAGTDTQILPQLLDDVRQLEQPSPSLRREAVLALLRKRDLPFRIETFQATVDSESKPLPGYNLIVEVGQGSRQILIGAHYDSHRLSKDRISQGAVDNGASVVILTRIIESLAGQTFRHQIKVIFFDLEETGFLGSKAYVRSHSTDPIDAYLNLDVTAFGDTLVFGPSRHPENRFLYRLLKGVCLEQELPFLEFPHFPSSDDRSFQAAGIPNLSMGIVPALDGHQLWLMMNGDSRAMFREGFVPEILGVIHSPLDTSERIDPQAMTLVHRAALELIHQLDRR